MADEREEVIQLRRKGDPTEPTISDVTLRDGQKFVFLERPRAPREEDFIEGAAHPCIPGSVEGIAYDVDYTRGIHPKHPFCYEIMRVPGRTAILQHSANVIMQLEGCQAPGMSVGLFDLNAIAPGMPPHSTVGVVSSVAALKAWEEALGRKAYRLIIKEA